MSWDSVLENWMSLIDCLCKDFPHLDVAAVRRFRGDQVKLVGYLADTHELTMTEAQDALLDWMTFTAPRSALPQAA